LGNVRPAFYDNLKVSTQNAGKEAVADGEDLNGSWKQDAVARVLQWHACIEHRQQSNFSL